MQPSDAPRIHPHDLAAERAVLGAILLDSSALAKAQEVMGLHDFYDSRHGRIFAAMAELASRGDIVDVLTLGNILEESGALVGIGGRAALAELLLEVASSSNIVHHSRIVRDHAVRRRLIRFAAELDRRAFGGEATEDLIPFAVQAVGELAFRGEIKQWRHARDIISDALSAVDESAKGAESLKPLSTGFSALDSRLGGWHRSDLVIVAARPSMGKTSLILGSAVAAAKQGFRVGVVSLEMSCRQLGIRMLGMEAPLDVHALRSGAIKHEGWWILAHAGESLSRVPLWVDDSACLTVDHIVAKARQLRAKHGLDLLVVDYLQLLQSPGTETRQQGIADASRGLKLLAKELDIPVVVLSQLSRECERRENKRPVLADLRDSGAIEQDADIVLFLYRHEVYDRDTEDRGVAEVLIRKHRNGPCGDVPLKFVEQFARFEDFAS